MMMEVDSSWDEEKDVEVAAAAAAEPAARARLGRGRGKRKTTMSPTFLGYKDLATQKNGAPYDLVVSQHEYTQFGGNKANGERYRFKNWKQSSRLTKSFSGGKVYRRVGWCPFKTEAGCQFRVQETCYGEPADPLSKRDFAEGGWPHCDHTLTTKKVDFMSMGMKCSVTAPILKLAPKEFVESLRVSGGFAISSKCAQSCRQWQVRRREYEDRWVPFERRIGGCLLQPKNLEKVKMKRLFLRNASFEIFFLGKWISKQ